MSKPSQIQRAIDLLIEERLPLAEKVMVIDLAIEKLTQQAAKQKPKLKPRAVSEKAS